MPPIILNWTTRPLGCRLCSFHLGQSLAMWPCSPHLKHAPLFQWHILPTCSLSHLTHVWFLPSYVVRFPLWSNLLGYGWLLAAFPLPLWSSTSCFCSSRSCSISWAVANASSKLYNLNGTIMFRMENLSPFWNLRTFFSSSLTMCGANHERALNLAWYPSTDMSPCFRFRNSSCTAAEKYLW